MADCLDGYREVSALLRQAVEEGLRGNEIKVGYGASGSNAEGLVHLLDTPNPPSKGWSQFQEKETETESEEGVEEDNADHRIVRSRRAVKPPTRDTPMLPLMVNGAQTQYVLWAGQDLEGLILRLPVLAEGAGKWIKAFEEETMGQLLAVGDIKAVLACVLGADRMERLLRSSGLVAATGTPVNDACHFDGYRANCWHQLRLMFPPRLSVFEMKVEPIKEEESPAAYLQAQEKRWHTETEQDLQNPAFRGQYRRALQDALPKPVRSRLRQVVGLITMPEEQNREQLIHAIDLYREEEDCAKERERELAKKLNQMQLEELTAKKKKVQAPVVSPDPSPGGSLWTADSLLSLGPQDTNWPPVPDWNKDSRYDRWGGDQRAPNFPQIRQSQSMGGLGNRPPKLVCWNCNQPGHTCGVCPNPPFQGESTRRPANKNVNMPILISEHIPVNLLGSDALCQL
ncbi:uncharacterized protein [Paramormyrops kingsleyae]|uniref:uncharacterized protein n=1 Tax=Paramormyrops kingsleyae TaxID=1676925 RepID=UPI003B972130